MTKKKKKKRKHAEAEATTATVASAPAAEPAKPAKPVKAATPAKPAKTVKATKPAQPPKPKATTPKAAAPKAAPAPTPKPTPAKPSKPARPAKAQSADAPAPTPVPTRKRGHAEGVGVKAVKAKSKTRGLDPSALNAALEGSPMDPALFVRAPRPPRSRPLTRPATETVTLSSTLPSPTPTIRRGESPATAILDAAPQAPPEVSPTPAPKSPTTAEIDATPPVPAAQPAGPKPTPQPPLAFAAGAAQAVREKLSRPLTSTEDYDLTNLPQSILDETDDMDEFGFDPAVFERIKPMLDFAYYGWYRVETMGMEHVPATGPAILVANHSGTLPWDGAMLRTAVMNEHPAKRDLRYLVEDFVYYLPFLGSFINRIGGVRACQENAERLLSQGRLVCAFPEGIKGISKLYSERYQLQRFGRGGFVKLAHRTKAPIVPVSIVGGEEIMPLLSRVKVFSRTLGLPYVPITPTFPWLGPAGLIPAPAKWYITFGAPVDVSHYSETEMHSDVLVAQITEQVRDTIQGQLDQLLDKRQSVVFG